MFGACHSQHGVIILDTASITGQVHLRFEEVVITSFPKISTFCNEGVCTFPDETYLSVTSFRMTRFDLAQNEFRQQECRDVTCKNNNIRLLVVIIISHCRCGASHGEPIFHNLVMHHPLPDLFYAYRFQTFFWGQEWWGPKKLAQIYPIVFGKI
jgi:hypothetical protein